MTRKADYLDALESAIRLQHKCRPTHKETVFVHEKTKDDETVWKGNVEVFDLKGHIETKTCYAWEHREENGDIKIFAILGRDFISSANRAVQAAFFVDEQPPSRCLFGIIKTMSDHELEGIKNRLSK
jgi:hypothetical protein